MSKNLDKLSLVLTTPKLRRRRRSKNAHRLTTDDSRRDGTVLMENLLK